MVRTYFVNNEWKRENELTQQEIKKLIKRARHTLKRMKGSLKDKAIDDINNLSPLLDD